MRKGVDIRFRRRIDHRRSYGAADLNGVRLDGQVVRAARLDVRSSGIGHEAREHEREVGRVGAVGYGGEVDIDGRARRDDRAVQVGRSENGLHKLRRERRVDARRECIRRIWIARECGERDLTRRSAGEGGGRNAFLSSFACGTTIIVTGH